MDSRKSRTSRPTANFSSITVPIRKRRSLCTVRMAGAGAASASREKSRGRILIWPSPASNHFPRGNKGGGTKGTGAYNGSLLCNRGPEWYAERRSANTMPIYAPVPLPPLPPSAPCPPSAPSATAAQVDRGFARVVAMMQRKHYGRFRSPSLNRFGPAQLLGQSVLDGSLQ